MKSVYKYIVLGLLLLIALHSQACDVCGCTINGTQFGIIPQFKKHFAGVRGSYRSFSATHKPLFSYEKQTVSQENFMSMEIWSRWMINDRIQFFTLFPIQKIEMKHENEIRKNTGIGDISISVLYSVLDNKSNSSGDLTHQLQVGGGIKLPTGDANKMFGSNEEWIPGFQLGTGALDITANINYILRYKKSGVISEFGYRRNQINHTHEFKYGDRYSSSIKYFYVWQWLGKSCMPTFGVTNDFAMKDFHEGETLELSGGNALFGHLGLDFFSNLLNGGLFVQPAIYNHVASGNLVPHTRYGANINVFF